jgi:hypothetical protein
MLDEGQIRERAGAAPGGAAGGAVLNSASPQLLRSHPADEQGGFRRRRAPSHWEGQRTSDAARWYGVPGSDAGPSLLLHGVEKEPEDEAQWAGRWGALRRKMRCRRRTRLCF